MAIIMPPAEPSAGRPRGGTAAPWLVSARRCVRWRGEWLPSVLRPAQDSSARGSCKTDSRGRDDEPFRCVRHIADSRRGHRLSRDAHVTTTIPPLANSWPTARTAQYVAANGSSFGLQKYYFFLNSPISFFIRSHLSAIQYFPVGSVTFL